MMRPLFVVSAGASAPSTFLRLLLSLLMLAMIALGGQALAQETSAEATPMRAPPPPEEGDPPYNYASMIMQSVPSEMVIGGLYDVSISMRNTGTTTWYGASGHKLGSASPLGNMTWGLSRVELTTSQTGPGNTGTFNFQVRAPSAPGTYTFQWQMLQEGFEWFGQATNPITVTVRDQVNNASFVGLNVPTQMEAGKRYSVSVTMLNTGETTWSTNTSYSLGSQNPQDNGMWGTGRVSLPGNIAPGQTAVFNFEVLAPQRSGTTNFQWRMVQDGKEWFGAYADNVAVNVVPSPRNDAALITQDIPVQMTAGRSYPATVIMRNTGTTTWTSAASYSLAVLQVNGVQYWNGGRAALPRSVAPGEDVAFTFTVTAPATPGVYSMPLRMVQDGVELFGALSNSAAINVVAAPTRNDAALVAVNIPSRMISGSSYPVSITMRNNGDTTWSAGTSHRLGEAGGLGTRWGLERVELTSSVAPGQQYTFAFQVTAPAPGDYNMQWRMLQEAVELFGATAGSPVTVTENLGNVTFIHTDGLGSPVARTDATGNVVSRTRYEPYGYVASGATPTIGFTGHVNDVDTGLTYMQQRYYDPVAGRFLSIDPVGTDANAGGSFNRYAYANNNPYTYIDPDGRDSEPVREPDKRDKQIADDLARARRNFCGAMCEGVQYNGDGLGSPGPSNLARPYMLLMGKAAGEVYDDWAALSINVLLHGGFGVRSLTAQEVRAIVKESAEIYGKGGKAFNVETLAALLRLWNHISAGASRVAVEYDGIMKQLPDGTFIGLRNGSKTGGKTIDVRPAVGKNYWIHIKP